MTVPAHTNAVGTYEKYVLVNGKNRGTENGRSIDVDWDASRLDAFSHKPGSNSGKVPGSAWKNPTTYSRKVARVTEDQPYTIHEVHSNGDVKDYTRPLSLSVPFWVGADDYAASLASNNAEKAKNKALNKLRDGSMQLGADIAEARKTADMIASNVKPIAPILRHIRKKDWWRIPEEMGLTIRDIRNGKYPSRKALEYLYGWRPLMGSIHDGMNLLANGFRDPNALIFSAKASSKDQYQRNFRTNGIFGTQVDCIDSYAYWSEFKFFYRMKSSLLANIDTLGLLNPLSLAWELTPLSFVVDWFIPVGNTLSALSATAGLEFVAGYGSHTRKRSVKGRGTLTEGWDGVDGGMTRSVSDPGSYRWENFEFYRDSLPEFPAPTLYANRNPFSTEHIIEAVALIRQLF